MAEHVRAEKDAQDLTHTILRFYGYTDADIAEAEQVHPGRVCNVDECYGDDGETVHPAAFAELGGTASIVAEIVMPWLETRLSRLTEALEDLRADVERHRDRRNEAQDDLADEKRRHAELRAGVEALVRNPSGEREWHNQGRSGTTEVVDVSTLRALLNTATEETP